MSGFFCFQRSNKNTKSKTSSKAVTHQYQAMPRGLARVYTRSGAVIGNINDQKAWRMYPA